MHILSSQKGTCTNESLYLKKSYAMIYYVLQVPFCEEKSVQLVYTLVMKFEKAVNNNNTKFLNWDTFTDITQQLEKW